MCDADYNVIWLDVGGEGSCGDAGVFEASGAKQALENNSLNFPAPEPLYFAGRSVPFFGAGDNAYPQRTYLMTPYYGLHLTLAMRIFNYRLSRARRVIENVFGIMAHKWRCILGCFQQKPEVVGWIVQTAACLHNLQRLRYDYASSRNDYDYIDEQGIFQAGRWRADAPAIAAMNVQPGYGNGASGLREGKELRDYLADYFCGPGQVSWQLRAIQNCW